MSKCIICGRELTSGEPPEMYNNMCLKCYQEQNYAEYPFKQGVTDYQKQIDQLKQQLAEKDKEIESIKQQLEETNAGYDFTYEQSTEAIKELEQNQTQLAIEELEKSKDTIKHFCNIHNDEYYGVKSQVKGIEQDVCEQIDQQIKELKGE